MKDFPNILARKDRSGNKQCLEDHLANVASLAGGFADAFDARDWGELVGWLHDLGKASAPFQRRIRGEELKVDHSTAGAQIAIEQANLIIKNAPSCASFLSYAVASHHSRLPGCPASFCERMEKGVAPLFPEFESWCIKKVLKMPCALPEKLDFLFPKMLLSALVDADRLDAAAFDSHNERPLQQTVEWSLWIEKLEAYLSSLQSSSPLQAVRSELMDEVRAASSKAGKIFSLIAPTGSGKTLASLLFALKQAQRHRKNRIIFAVPRITITEQIAAIFTDLFGEEVLEHHSMIMRSSQSDDPTELGVNDTAYENWDKPLIVTTSVQLFDSLFAYRASDLRKIHRIANSVLVLDEAHLLPEKNLSPILYVLKLLSERFFVSIILVSATCPDFAVIEDRVARNIGRESIGLNVQQILENHENLFKKIPQRVSYQYHPEPKDWGRIAEEIMTTPACLAIVNTRKDCRDLFQALVRLAPQETLCFHLSCAMCGAHRNDVLRDIKRCLKEKRQVYVVSTSLIEVGVDIDFPVVYRAITGFDSIVQSAGRCNREGRALGELHIFQPRSNDPPCYEKRLSCARHLLEKGCLPDHENALKRYFEDYLNSIDLDVGQFLETLKAPKKLRIRGKECLVWNFQEIALKTINNDDQVQIVVPLCQSAHLSKTDLYEGIYFREKKRLMRQLQPFVVSIWSHDLEKSFVDKWQEKEGVIFLDEGVYDSVLGLQPTSASDNTEPFIV